MVSRTVQTLVDLAAVAIYGGILGWMWYTLYKWKKGFVVDYTGLSFLYYTQLLFQFLMFRLKYSLGPRERFLFCCPCSEKRILNFGTINLLFSCLMIIVAIWDIIDTIQSDGRYNEDRMCVVYDGVSLVLAVETLIIYFKFPQLVLTDEQVGERDADRRRRETGPTPYE